MIEFQVKGNKFLHIGDYEKVQQFLVRQLDVRFAERINSFLPAVFWAMQDILGPYSSYYWTIWQSEWATDLILPRRASLRAAVSQQVNIRFMEDLAALQDAAPVRDFSSAYDTSSRQKRCRPHAGATASSQKPEEQTICR